MVVSYFTIEASLGNKPREPRDVIRSDVIETVLFARVLVTWVTLHRFRSRNTHVSLDPPGTWVGDEDKEVKETKLSGENLHSRSPSVTASRYHARVSHIVYV